MTLCTQTTLIDSHCHLDFIEEGSAQEVCARAESMGVGQLIVPGVYPEQWHKIRSIKSAGLPIEIAVGVHPWWLNRCHLNDCEALLIQAVHKFKPIAIGETGLDKRLVTPLEWQVKFLNVHLQVANSVGLPVILHNVHAQAELLHCIKQNSTAKGGVIHAFSGSYEIAKQFWKRGYYLGVGGTITYERAQKTRDAIKRMPLESLLLETDAPDMPISGKQGQPNLPEYLSEIAQVLAELKDISLDEVVRKTRENTQQLFNLAY